MPIPMDTEGSPESEEGAVVFPNWMRLERIFRQKSVDDLDAAREAAKNKTAAQVKIDSGHSCFVSFTLAAPPDISYFNLHWPEEPVPDNLFAFVRATDKNLVLFDIYVPLRGRRLPDLFVYTVAGPSPSVQQLPRRKTKSFLDDKFSTGILQRESNDDYIVAVLNVDPKEEHMSGKLCFFRSSDPKAEWEIFTEVPVRTDAAYQLPNLWYTDDVLAFDGRYLCWLDYFSGVLLCDFSKNIVDSRVLQFVHFPGGIQYPEEARFPRYFPGRYRNVCISEGKMCYVHIDNDFHETVYSGWGDEELSPERCEPQQQPPPKITIWTLNSSFKWDLHCYINLSALWGQRLFLELGLPPRLPEFPVISVDDPGVLCCLLREEEFDGKEWMIMIGMEYARLLSWTVLGAQDQFSDTTQLPTIFSKYLQVSNRAIQRFSDPILTDYIADSAKFLKNKIVPDKNKKGFDETITVQNGKGNTLNESLIDIYKTTLKKLPWTENLRTKHIMVVNGQAVLMKPAKKQLTDANYIKDIRRLFKMLKLIFETSVNGVPRSFSAMEFIP